MDIISKNYKKKMLTMYLLKYLQENRNRINIDEFSKNLFGYMSEG